jgi:hypothetical protein
MPKSDGGEDRRDYERRGGARRHRINLRSLMLITAMGMTGSDREQYPFRRGMVLDISLSGLALII